MVFSLIICTYNRDKYIYETLKRIATNTFPEKNYEIILVNNNSTDNTAQECLRFSQEFQKVNFLYFIEQSQGLSFARNRGIQEAHGEYLIFLDDDSFIKHNYLEHLYNDLKNYPAAAFGGKITPLYENQETPAWISKWSYSWVSGLNKGSKTQLFTGNSFPIGANMGFHRNCFQYTTFNTKLGRNKGNMLAGEEKDIFNLLKSKGLKIYYFPDIEVLHVIPPQRTTYSYIRKLALGVGQSERIRTLNISFTAYIKRIINECIKWCASIILCTAYTLRFTPIKGFALLFFRWYVSQGLLFSKITPTTTRN